MKTRKVRIGSLHIGGGTPIRVQSMTCTKTKDINTTVRQIKSLESAGCEIIRVGVPDMDSAQAIAGIKKKINIPIVADIHYDYRLAIESIKAGADKIRINPGNIGSAEKVNLIINEAKKRKTAIRIGVNSGSLKQSTAAALKEKSGNKKADMMVASLLEYVSFFEKQDFYSIVVSLKASDVNTTVAAYRLFSQYRDYPMHIGITEAGTELGGLIKSSVGLGILLHEGLGDTVRVSLTAAPEKEVYAAYRILGDLGLRKRGVDIISCPTCARTEIDVISLAHKVEAMAIKINKPLKIAVMGCSVNGPGEAREADIGIAGGRGIGIIFKKGSMVKKVSKKDLLRVFENELGKIVDGKE